MRNYPGQTDSHERRPAYMMQPDPPAPCRATLTTITGFKPMDAAKAIERIKIGHIVWIAPEDLETVSAGIGGAEIGAVLGQEKRAGIFASMAAQATPAAAKKTPPAQSIKIYGIEIAHLLSEEERQQIAEYAATVQAGAARAEGSRSKIYQWTIPATTPAPMPDPPEPTQPLLPTYDLGADADYSAVIAYMHRVIEEGTARGYPPPQTEEIAPGVFRHTWTLDTAAGPHQDPQE